MKEPENLHANHRERMYQRFLTNPDSFAEHELLELLLFYSVPRIDVNPLAHKLIDRFGSISNVFEAENSSLLAIDGIGEKTAAFIKLIGKLTVNLSDKRPLDIINMSVNGCKQALIEFFAPCKYESFVLLFINKSNRVVERHIFTRESESEVIIDLKDVSAKLSESKPVSVIAAHNHLSGNVSPSEKDIITTKKLAVLFNLQGVSFLDHIIVSNDKVYSFFAEGELDFIKETVRRNLDY